MEADAIKSLETFGQQSGLATLISEYSIYAVILFALLFFKSTIENVVAGCFLNLGNEYSEEDCVILDGRVGRIIRIGAVKTVFYLYTFRKDESGNSIISGGTKLVVENKAITTKNIEKPLPKLDFKDFYKESELPNGISNGQH
jgi:small-conductance mechanosensitive channel